ncbi:SDR family NAD(P)-dependent oxidoreductase [Variovorax sp. J31P207]|uniref:SDR family NAD(P)-dependent oxidoreductase n=1 Tax=Variovorax sp. J31P207 TaxID=3053510 RepID=UPI00257787C0|nr:SDR family NAD(P)-dependent oxidoreductase [Variovorax sp. J31P207]MDM0066759.1 SDR family NAD(P)-dependent oxidoreductase [Variovorax sp. J31P207]
MTNSFGNSELGRAELGATSTADDALSGIDLRGMRILVTGVSSGIGMEAARSLAAHGAQVVGTARDIDSAVTATAAVLADAADGGGLELVALDLASLASVRTCADALVEDGRRFDVVIANAGVMATPLGRTPDGFETQLGTNHLGHFAFINRIAPLIVNGGRVVVLSSASHRSADFTLDDLNFERTAYEPQMAYARSKTANILFAVEFDRRHKVRGVRATAVHPGTIRTGLGRHIGFENMELAVQRLNAQFETQGQPQLEWKSVAQGAATTVWAGDRSCSPSRGALVAESASVEDSTDPSLGWRATIILSGQRQLS